jgi:PAS domain S-box-containing protein
LIAPQRTASRGASSPSIPGEPDGPARARSALGSERTRPAFDVAWPVRVLASVAVVIGGAHLAAWLGGAAPAWSAAGAITMKTNMSLALVVAGAALLLSRSPARRARVAGIGASLLVVAIGVLTLGEHAFRVDLHIDQLLATELPGAIATASPNRFGVPGAISLTLLGSGLLALFRRGRASAYFGLATLLVVVVPAVGWLYRIGALFSSARTTGIAWPTVVALSALAVGLMLCGPRDGMPALLLRDDVGAALLRRLLPVAVIAPLAIGLLVARGERLGLYGPDVAGGITAIAVVVVFAALLWRAAANLSVSAERRARATAALSASEERLSHYAELVEHAPVLVRDGQDKIVVWNRGMERLYGYSRETALGKVSHDLLQTRFPVSLADIDGELRRSGAWEGELRHRRADGTEVIVSSRQMVHHDATGARAAVVEVNSDVTALRTAEQALLEAARRKDEFLATLSHELRNPLAPIRNSAYVLRHAAPGSEQAQRAAEVIERQAEHLTRLVDDLLDVTRIVRGKIELRRSPIDLREVVLRAAEDHRASLEDGGVAFQTELPAAKVRAEVDATRVTQVVGNLLHNAAKFTRRGDEVRLALAVVDGAAEIRVRDTGPGIEPTLLPQLFEPFVQGERSLARAEGGLGLGLALVKGITELHGGTVSAASAGKGKGAEFMVRLPLVEAQAPRPDGRGAVPCQPGRRRILVVDDNADAAESLADLLRLQGHLAEVARDGPAALAALAATVPDVILCDIGLPGMSGYEVARTVRAGLHGAVRLVALTGYAQPEDVRRAKDAGFDAHLAKPPDPDELARVLS